MQLNTFTREKTKTEKVSSTLVVVCHQSPLSLSIAARHKNPCTDSKMLAAFVLLINPKSKP